MKKEPTIVTLHDACADETVLVLDPLITAAEDDGVYRAPEWIDLLIWNVFVAFGVGISSNAAFAGLQSLFDKQGHATRPELDANADALSNEPLDQEAKVTFETRQAVARAIEKTTRQTPTEAQLDEIIKLMRSHLRENDGTQ